MDYFDGISFLGSGNIEHHMTVHREQTFNGYYGIQYNHRGHLDFAIGGAPIVSVEGAWAFITYPGESFYYGPPPEKERQHTYVCFKGPRVDRFIQSGLITIDGDRPLVKVTHSERFLATMLNLTELLNQTPIPHSRAVLLLEDLLLRLNEQPVKTPAVGGYLKSAISRLVDEMRAHPQLDWDFKKEAVSIGISYPHFRRIFKQLLEVSPGRFIINTRLQRAADSLLRGDDQISAIAEKCGFNDGFYFSRLFKKSYHLSPLSYRKEFQHFSR
ncbi:MAG: AraC family transcriptional regulator [Kiritimatiellaeota bacterium]|nr:AraC family transcriptional regulator [Kiritimatiellota bacterium]